MSPPARRPLDVETLWQIERVGQVALAPDGARAVCSSTRYSMERNRASTSLWLLDCKGGGAPPRRLTRCGDKDAQAAWSPRGDRIAFIAKREQQGRSDATPQLYLIAPDGGEAVRVSDFAPGIESFKWLPDGRQVVFAAWVWPELRGSKAQVRRHAKFEARKESGYATSQAFYRHWDHSIPMGRALHLLLLDLKSGRVTDLFEGSALELARDGGDSACYDVHPDGRRVAFVHDTAAVPLAGNALALSEIDLRNGRHATLVDDPAWDFGAPRYSPDGARVAVSAAHVGVHHTALAQPALVAHDGSWHLLANGWEAAVEGVLRWTADGAAVCFAAQHAGRCHLWRHRLADGALQCLHRGGWVQGFDVGANGLIVAADSATQPVQVFACTSDQPPRRIESFNDALLHDVALGEVREVAVAGALGEPVQMWLTFPPAFDAGRPHAVTHVIHGGPYAAAGDTFSYRWNPHLLAAPGQVIAQVNFHGSSGFGFAFRHSLIGRQGELELQDIEAGTDWLLAQPWADPQRIYASGGSYGGFLVAWMNGHLPAWPAGRYRAYVCHAGVFDRVSTFSADSYPVRPKDLQAQYWADLPRVLAQSPHAFAAAMATPTLVIHGAQDFRVPDCNGLAYYNTLKARAVDARLLWFPDENHWVLKPQNSRLWYREFIGWLERHGLRGG